MGNILLLPMHTKKWPIGFRMVYLHQTMTHSKGQSQGHVCKCVSMSVTVVSTGRTIVKINNVKKLLIDFNICHRMASFRKLHTLTVTYFFEDKKCETFIHLKR